MSLPFLQRFLGGSRRGQIVKRNAVGAFGIKIFAIAIQLLQVPIVLSYLNKETYGLYLTITSIVMWAHNFDFGLGSGLRYKLTEALSVNDLRKGKELVSTAYLSLSGIMGLAWLVITPLVLLLDWNQLLNCKDIPNVYLSECIMVVLVCFLTQFVLDLITIVLQANQMSAISTVFRPLANMISLIGVIVLKQFSSNSLLWACLMLTVPMVIVLLVGNLYLFAGKFREISPSVKCYKKAMLKEIYSLGTKFFLSSLSSLIIFNSANLLISNMINPAEVSVYNTAYTYYSLIIVFHGIILTPFWPAITDGYVKNELDWLKGCMCKLSKVTALFSLGSLLLMLVSKFAFNIWIGDKLTIPMSLSAILCVYAIGNVWSAMYNCFIVGVGKAQLTMYLSIIKIISYIPVAIFFVRQLGIIGLVLSLIMVNTIPNIVLAYLQYKRIITKRAVGIWNR